MGGGGRRRKVKRKMYVKKGERKDRKRGRGRERKGLEDSARLGESCKRRLR